MASWCYRSGETSLIGSTKKRRRNKGTKQNNECFVCLQPIRIIRQHRRRSDRRSERDCPMVDDRMHELFKFELTQGRCGEHVHAR
jgi:hypothetical protein